MSGGDLQGPCLPSGLIRRVSHRLPVSVWARRVCERETSMCVRETGVRVSKTSVCVCGGGVGWGRGGGSGGDLQGPGLPSGLIRRTSLRALGDPSPQVPVHLCLGFRIEALSLYIYVYIYIYIYIYMYICIYVYMYMYIYIYTNP